MFKQTSGRWSATGYGLAGLLEARWSQLCGMHLHHDAPSIPKGDTTVTTESACLLLGFCMCSGQGQLAYWFHSNTIALIKPSLVAPRQKPKSKAQPKPAIKPPKPELRVLCENSRLVLRLQPVHGECDRAALKDDLDLVDKLDGWRQLTENAILKQMEETAMNHALKESTGGKQCLMDDVNVEITGDIQDITPETLWFEIGYCNFSSFHFSGHMLCFIETRSSSRVELGVPQCMQFQTSFEFFRDQVDFNRPWVASYYKVLDGGALLPMDEMAPNRVLVEHCKGISKMLVWKGAIAEKERRKRKPAPKRKPRAKGKARIQPSSSVAHLHELEDAPAGNGEELQSENDVERDAIIDEMDEALMAAIEAEDSQGSENDMLPEDVFLLDNLPEDAGPEPELDDVPDLNQQHSIGNAASSSSHDVPPVPPPVPPPPSVPLAPVPSPEEAPNRRIRGPVGSKPRGIAEAMCQIDECGAIHFYEKSQVFQAHCKFHEGDCRIQRTSKAHSSASRYWQGRPLGHLGAWLKRAQEYETRQDHCKASSFPFKDRHAARQEFSRLHGWNELESKERPKGTGEDSEPDYFT